VKRPSPPLRVAILIAAIACLGLAMCHRTKPQPTQPATAPANQAPLPQNTAPAAPEEGGSSGTPMKIEEGKTKDAPRESFPATKAPGRLY